MASKIRTCEDFLPVKDEFIFGLFKKKEFLASHLLGARKKLQVMVDELERMEAPKDNTNGEVEEKSDFPLSGNAVEMLTVINKINQDTNGSPDAPSTEALESVFNSPEISEEKAILPAGYNMPSVQGEYTTSLKDIMIVTLPNGRATVSEKLQGKRIYRDWMAMSVATGKAFDNIQTATACAERLKDEGNYHSIVSVNYDDILQEQAINIWLVTCLGQKKNYSVFMSFKSEDLGEAEIEDRTQYGKHFNELSKAQKYTEEIISQFNSLFCNSDSEIINKTLNQIDWENDIVYSRDGKALFLKSKGALHHIWADDDLPARFVYVAEYVQDIKSKIIDASNSNDERQSGRFMGYCFGEESSLPAIRGEIYRTDGFLKRLQEDPEFYAEDIASYGAYKDALIECIAVQKAHALTVAPNITILVFDPEQKIDGGEFSTTIPFTGLTQFPSEETASLDIDYSIRRFDSFDELLNCLQKDPFMEVAICETEQYGTQVMEFQCHVLEKTPKALYVVHDPKDIKKILRHCVSLSLAGIDMSGNSGSNIDDSWIPNFDAASSLESETVLMQ